jgi:hypothetical protein
MILQTLKNNKEIFSFKNKFYEKLYINEKYLKLLNE